MSEAQSQRVNRYLREHPEVKIVFLGGGSLSPRAMIDFGNRVRKDVESGTNEIDVPPEGYIP